MNDTLIIASDHAGYDLKKLILKLMGRGLFKDLGTNSSESVDYPDFAKAVVHEIINDPSKKGILICGSGIGMSISANRYKGIRASLCYTPDMAELSRKHNDANILVLPGRFMDVNIAKLCIDNFLNTKFEGERHKNRIEKIDQ
tara:strand:- start:8359 stop:8787 length:429 start_codon:yes stop_codon:yes gene_type:complete